MNTQALQFIGVGGLVIASVVSGCAAEPEATTAQPEATTASEPDSGSSTVLDRFEPGTLLESVERDADGNTYVSVLDAEGGRVVRVDPQGEREVLARYPSGGIGTLVFDADGVLHGTVGSSMGDPTVPRAIVRFEPDGRVVTEAELPPSAGPNGITADAEGSLYVADSALGVVWRRPPGESEAYTWADGEALAVDPQLGFPGPNGIKVFNGEVYVSNPSQSTLVRIPIQDDGEAGTPYVYARDVPCDDFAIDVEGNLYATTHPFNSLVVVRPDGRSEARLTSADGLWGPTAAIFGEGADDTTRLFVVTDGNAFGALLPAEFRESDMVREAEISSLDVGIAGAPVPGS